MMRMALLIFFLMASCGFALANPNAKTAEKLPPMLEDYMVRQTLTIKGEAAAYRYRLPADFYQSLIPGGLRYLSIFNDNGHLVPWKIENARVDNKTSTEIIPLGFFNGYQKRQVAPKSEHLSIYRGSDALSINLDLAPSFDQFPAEAMTQPATPNVYYVDLSELPDKEKLRKLDFQWQQAKESGFTFDVTVSESSDFQRWKMLGQGRLVDLKQGPERLKIEQITITAPKQPYLKIQFSGKEIIPPLETLVGHFVSHEKASLPTRWQPVQLSPLAREPGYEFSLDGEFSLNHIKIDAALPNAIGEVTVYRWQGDRWQFVARQSISQFESGDSRRQKNIIDVGFSVNHSRTRNTKRFTTRDRRWKLLFSRESTDYLQSTPEVSFSYEQKDLVFLRQGESSFLLAYNVPEPLRQQRHWPDWHKSSRFPTSDFESTDVTVGERSNHTPVIVKEEKPSLTATRIFWLGTVIFVLVLLVIARHLLRELRRSNQE